MLPTILDSSDAHVVRPDSALATVRGVIETSLVAKLDPCAEVMHVQDGELLLRHGGAAPTVVRARIQAVMRRLMVSEAGIQPPHVEHEFADGLYLRKLFIPAGVLLAGKVHLRDCMNVVASGDISVLTELGSARLRAGWTGVSKRGIQKLGLAHADTVFINVFRTDKTDVVEVEADLFSNDPIPSVYDEDREDYAVFLSEHGLTEQAVRSVVDDMSDHIELPHDCKATLSASRIEGNGMFAVADIQAGEEIGPARVGNRRTVLGRRMNHSKQPNCHCLRDQSGGALAFASRFVRSGEELTIDYRESLRLNVELSIERSIS